MSLNDKKNELFLSPGQARECFARETFAKTTVREERRKKKTESLQKKNTPSREDEQGYRVKQGLFLSHLALYKVIEAELG